MKYFLSLYIVTVLVSVASAEGSGDKSPLISNTTHDIIFYPYKTNKKNPLNGHKIKLTYRELFFKLLQHRCPIH